VIKRAWFAGIPIALSLAALAQTAVQKLPGPIAARQGELIGGPFAVNVGPNSATVAWVTRPAGRRAPEDTTRADKLTFTGLQPGTRYLYDFKAGGQTVEGSFKTPPTGPEPFDFVVYGDTRSRHDVHRRVVDAILKSEPDFVIHTGDLVATGGDTALWSKFFSIERELLRRAAFFPAVGNHEHNSSHYFTFLQARPYYSFDWGSAHFTVLDTDFGNIPNKAEFWQEQFEWLESDLAKNQDADLRFVIFHHPPYSAMKKRGINEDTVKFVPLFEKYGVHAVFSGHDHAYEHFLRNGVRYIVTGGGGAPLYNVDTPLPGITQKLEKVEHFVFVKVEGRWAAIEALALDGRRIDYIELQPRAALRARRIEREQVTSTRWCRRSWRTCSNCRCGS
jgi:3',5'-cyclic AMP phosphodiesterase CpdA